MDASAVLALLHEEPGHESVKRLLPEAYISSVNLAEVLTKLSEQGSAEADLKVVARNLPITVVPFDEPHAVRAAALRRATKSAGLSLGDRACIATAQILSLPAVTTDRAWSKLRLPVAVKVVR